MTYDRSPGHLPLNGCGPATPGSPFELPGLGWSDFARHYFRNHGCFLFLQVLRWFTSLSLLGHPMNSDDRSQCSHWLGFPIRKSPDRRLLASPRGLSQLTTSFIACLRQGIHTHALSSLTTKSTVDTKCDSCALRTGPAEIAWPIRCRITCSSNARQNIQFSKNSICPDSDGRRKSPDDPEDQLTPSVWDGGPG